LAQAPAADILVNNSGGPPPGDFRAWTRDDWIAAFDTNMLSAVFLTRAYVDGMIERGFGRIVNITSIAVKQPQPLLGLSTSARLALTGFAVATGRETVRHNVTINNLLPGYFDTERLRKTFDVWSAAGQQPDDRAEQARAAIPAGRFGTPREFGEMCAFLCGSGSGYITGQNILLDGGLYAGLL
jgi:3-oxoacyl-[acyl-carrier protein] reductase